MLDPSRATLRYKLDCGRSLGAAWLSLGSVAVCELAAHARPDVIIIDMQHGLWDRTSLEAAIGAVPPDLPVMVRVAENSPTAIGQALDAGAEGVIVPLVESAKQARAAVAAAHFPPKGVRSGGGVRPLLNFGTYVAHADRAIVVAVMIETQRGLKHASRIAGTDGVDMVFIGTGDLALSLETFPAFDEAHEAACGAIKAACREHWTHCGIFTSTAEAARARRQQGYRLVVTACDTDLITRGLQQAGAEFNRVEATARTLPPPQQQPVLSAPASAGQHALNGGAT
jgi:2-keto-3-deoxy-L-rhamnonate aldolase RhmA